MNGKGSTARPMAVSREEYARRWDAVFGRFREFEIDDTVPGRYAVRHKPCGRAWVMGYDVFRCFTPQCPECRY